MEAASCRDYSDLGRMLVKLQTVNPYPHFFRENAAVFTFISFVSFRSYLFDFIKVSCKWSIKYTYFFCFSGGLEYPLPLFINFNFQPSCFLWYIWTITIANAWSHLESHHCNWTCSLICICAVQMDILMNNNFTFTCILLFWACSYMIEYFYI